MFVIPRVRYTGGSLNGDSTVYAFNKICYLFGIAQPNNEILKQPTLKIYLAMKVMIFYPS